MPLDASQEDRSIGPHPTPDGTPGGIQAQAEGASNDFRELARRILHLANAAGPGGEFEREVARHWLEAAGCTSLEFTLEREFGATRNRVRRSATGEVRLEALPPWEGLSLPIPDPLLTVDESVAPGTGVRPPDLLGSEALQAHFPLAAGRRRVGWVSMGGERPAFSVREEEFHRAIAEMVALALVNRRTQWALRERVKELTCLYGISRLTEKDEAPLDEILHGVLALIPPGWQYPEVTQARIVVDGKPFCTAGFREVAQRQSAEIMVAGERRGSVEVVYAEPRPIADEGPFLREERSLIDAIATSLELILEQRRAVVERVKLEEQLRHADRLATIGQLSAGVAHELNEPLGAILGFAQLARQAAGLPDQAAADVDKIIAAALHAREVVRKLMLFARQTPPRKSRVSLNELAEEGLYFLEARGARQEVKLVRDLDRELPRVTADRGQMQQVLVNLVVNAVQAMPDGGTLTIRTRRESGAVALIVEDTGVGMEPEVRSQIFVPFFTTKDVGQGTGLGLSVVHGIVSAHGGTIMVESAPRRGSRFEIRLPLAEDGEGEDVRSDSGSTGSAVPPPGPGERRGGRGA